MAANMSSRYAEANNKIASQQDNPIQASSSNGVKETDHAYVLPRDVNNGVAIPKRFFNKEGEVDLSKATGNEAVAYLNALGLNIGIPMLM